jgi:hypothetical protein
MAAAQRQTAQHSAAGPAALHAGGRGSVYPDAWGQAGAGDVRQRPPGPVVDVAVDGAASCRSARDAAGGSAGEGATLVAGDAMPRSIASRGGAGGGRGVDDGCHGNGGDLVLMHDPCAQARLCFRITPSYLLPANSTHGLCTHERQSLCKLPCQSMKYQSIFQVLPP